MKPNLDESTASLDNAANVCELRVGGMDCPSCADDISRTLHRLEGVEDVRVDVVGGSVKVAYAEGKVARGDLRSAVRRLGYQVHDDEKRRHTFIVEGMDCADEVRQLEGKLGPLPGVTQLRFDLVGRKLTVEGTATVGEIQRAVKEIGMTARADGQATTPLAFWERRGRMMMAAVSGILLVAGLMTGWAGGPATVEVALLALSAVSGGWFIAPRGLRAARNGVLTAIMLDDGLRRSAEAVSSELKKINPESLREVTRAIVGTTDESKQSFATSTAPNVSGTAGGVPSKTPALDKFTVNLTEDAKQGKIDPILGRDEEIRQIIDILIRRRQNNPILTGEAGVGKTAVVEGFALRIASGDVPDPLKDVCVRSLDLGLLQAGASVKGEF